MEISVPKTNFNTYFTINRVVLLVPFYFIIVGNSIFDNPGGRLEDAIDGLYQIKNNWQVATGFMGTVISIAFFNFAGISVTKEISATTRTVLDSVRTLVIWLFSLAVQWQAFSVLQLAGFLVLIVGMFLYNDVIIRPTINKWRNRSSSIIEETATDDNQTDGNAVGGYDNEGNDIKA